MSERKQFGALDLAKFIAAILIIILHTNPFGTYSKVISFGFRSIITVVAVPFFFVTSGYLFFAKLNTLQDGEKGTYFKKYIKRLVLMYLLWSAVYFVFVLINWIRNGVGVIDVLQYIKRFFFEGSYSTIWFLPALITAVAIVYFLRKKFTYSQIFYIAIPFYVIACLGSSYFGLSEKIPVISHFFDAYYWFFDTIKNGVLSGFIFVALGGVFSENSYQMKPAKAFVLTGISFVFVALESVVQAYFGWHVGGVDTKLSLIPFAIFSFLFVMSLNIKSGPAFVWMRKISLLMFLSQRIFITVFEWFLHDTIFMQNTMIYFICILTLTIAFSWAFICLSEKCKILKKFY